MTASFEFGFSGTNLAANLVLSDLTPSKSNQSYTTWLTGKKGIVRVASIYAPNGNPQPGPKFDYKLAWLERLRKRAKALLVA